jgi:hypothetical protein
MEEAKGTSGAWFMLVCCATFRECDFFRFLC